MRVTVVGAGNAGCAVAADLALAGAKVTLYELPRFAANLEPIRERGGIHLNNYRLDGTGRRGEAVLAEVTTDAVVAATGADAVLVAAQAVGHEEIARTFAPFLGPGQLVVLFTGYGSSLLVRRLVPPGVLLAETVTLPYACRLEGPAQVEIHGRAYRAIPTAALPATDTPRVLDLLRAVYPELVAATNVLEAALLNTNVTRHTVPTLLNIGRIEHAKGDFSLWREGFTPAVWRVFDALDAEKMALLRALGLPARSFLEVRRMMTDLTLEEQAEHYGSGPAGADTRYLTEDVPIGLVLFASLGRLLGVPTPTADALIQLASAIGGTDYQATGRTVERLGLADLTAAGLAEHLEAAPGARSAEVQASHPAGGEQ